MTSPTPARNYYIDQQHSSMSADSSSPVIVGPREQLAALRRNLPTHAELLRVCEQFPEEGDRLSAYVQEVERRIVELENQRRAEHRENQRRRHEIAMETAKEIERKKQEETENKVRTKEEAIEKNKREQQRERRYQRHEKSLQEAANQEALRKFRERRDVETKEDAEARLEHWYVAIDSAQEAREKHRNVMKVRMENERREWQKRVQESRIKKEEKERDRTEQVQDRNARLSNMAEHKHDLAVQARLRRETGKDEKDQMIRAAVRRNEATQVAQMMDKIEENDARHEDIVAEQKQRRAQRLAALRRDRENRLKNAKEKLRQLNDDHEEKRMSFEEKQQRELQRHVQQHKEIRQQVLEKIRETNERRNRAHHAVKENREAELEEAARRVVARTAKVGAAVGIGLAPTGQHSVLDEEMSKVQHNNNNNSVNNSGFRLNLDRQTSQSRRRHLNNYNDDEDEKAAEARRQDPRTKPAIFRMDHLMPKVVVKPNSKNNKDASFSVLEFILDTRPKNQQGKNLKMISESAKAEEKKKKEDEEKEQQKKKKEEEAAKEKKKKEEEEEIERKKVEDMKKTAATPPPKASPKEEEEKRVAATPEPSTTNTNNNNNIQQKLQTTSESQRHAVPESQEKQEQQQQNEANNNNNNNNNNTTTTKKSSSSLSSSPKFRAVFIADSNNRTIPHTSSDAAAAIAMLQNILGSEHFTQRQILTDDEAFLGRTSSASKESILAAFDWLVSESKTGDSCVVYYIGQDLLDSPSTSSPILLSSQEVKETLLVKLASIGVRCTLISNTPSGNHLVQDLPVNWEWKDDSHKFVSVPSSTTPSPYVVSSSSSSSNPNTTIMITSLSGIVSENASTTVTDAIAEVLSSKISQDDGKPHVKFGEFLTRCHDAVANKNPQNDDGVFRVATSFTPSSLDFEFNFM